MIRSIKVTRHIYAPQSVGSAPVGPEEFNPHHSQLRLMRTALMGSVASVAMILLSNGRALADCQPNAPNPGDTVTCTGNNPDGTDPVNTPVTVNVENGATVEGSGIEIPGAGNSTVTNNGSLRGSPSSVRLLDGVAGFLELRSLLTTVAGGAGCWGVIND